MLVDTQMQQGKFRCEPDAAAPLSLTETLFLTKTMPMFPAMAAGGSVKVGNGRGIGDDLGALVPSLHRVNVQTWLLSLNGGRSG